MAKQTINPGTAPTGAGGDTFRSGSAKLQANDDELYNQLGATAQGVLPAALPVSKGGTGATTAAAARTGLGLGTASIRNVGLNKGDVILAGNDQSGIMDGVYVESQSSIHATATAKSINATLFVRNSIASGVLTMANGGSAYYLATPTSRSVSFNFTTADGATSNILLRTTANTTVDANGFIKNASPIVQLFADRIELNDEARQQEISFEKLGIGDYLIKGSSGFAQEGWYIETPKDANGNLLVAVVYEQLENGDISVKTYDYMLNSKGRIVADTETPLDIPEARWIDLRLQELPQPEIEVTDDPEQ